MRITPDEAVADAIATVFCVLRGARQRAAGDAAPARGGPPAAAPGDQRPPGAVGDADLSGGPRHPHQPCYAGVYAYGRKRHRAHRRGRRGPRAAAPRAARGVARVPRKTITPATSPSSATWPTRSGCAPTGARRAGRAAARAREGRALLQGLIRCGRCGRRMQVGYSGKTLVPHYRASAASQLYGTERCQSVGGRRIEQVVLDPSSRRWRPAGDRRDAPRDRARRPRPPGAGALGRARARARADPRRPRPPPVRRAASPRTGSSRARWSASGSSASPTSATPSSALADDRRPPPRPADRRGDRVVPARRR